MKRQFFQPWITSETDVTVLKVLFGLAIVAFAGLIVTQLLERRK